ncbi:MAG: site-specific DNA-methyltransferase [Deltaproteobacteria bacterium]|nr:MAG: site-specific DNA-methyltransferase [Deltaproteobacteria bacterium]
MPTRTDILRDARYARLARKDEAALARALSHGVLAEASYAGGAAWRLLAGDSLELLEAIPPRSVDLVFADPPYNLSNGGFTCQSGRRAKVDKGAWDRSHGVEADHRFHARWLEAVQRILKPSGTLWVSGTQHVIFSIGYAMQRLGYHLLNTITWFKPNAPPNLACRYFTHSTELIIWAAPRKVKPLAHHFAYAEMKAENGGKQMRDLWTMPAPGKSEKAHGRHPTQKPLALLDRIVRASTVPGALVLDPFSGSGTTGVAAVALGRRYLGIEREAAYLDLSARRIAEVAGAGAGKRAGGVSGRG